MNSVAWNNDLEKIIKYTSISGRNFTGGTLRSCLNMKTTRWHYHHFAPHYKTPSVRKLCEKLWDKWDQQKVLMLQLCFNEAINSYKKYGFNKHRRNLVIMENSIEINEISYQKPNYSGNKNYNQDLDLDLAATIRTPTTRESTLNQSASSVLDWQRFTIFVNFWMSMLPAVQIRWEWQNPPPNLSKREQEMQHR